MYPVKDKKGRKYCKKNVRSTHALIDISYFLASWVSDFQSFAE